VTIVASPIVRVLPQRISVVSLAAGAAEAAGGELLVVPDATAATASAAAAASAINNAFLILSSPFALRVSFCLVRPRGVVSSGQNSTSGGRCMHELGAAVGVGEVDHAPAQADDLAAP
jgi:hypothetical protein